MKKPAHLTLLERMKAETNFMAQKLGAVGNYDNFMQDILKSNGSFTAAVKGILDAAVSDKSYVPNNPKYDELLSYKHQIKMRLTIADWIESSYEFRLNLPKIKDRMKYEESDPIFHIPYEIVSMTMLVDREEFAPTYLSLMEPVDTIQLNGKNYRYWTISLLDTSNATKENSYPIKWQVIYIPDLHPRFFLDCGINKCANKNLRLQMNNSDTADKYCLLSAKTASLCLNQQVNNIKSYLDLVWTILYSYSNRTKKTMSTKTMLSTKPVVKPELSEKDIVVIKTITNEEVNSHTKTEGWANKEYPEHHASPHEHQRKGHSRHLSDGRVIWINETTVNKGKPRTKYEFR